MEAIRNYLDSMFAGLPNTASVLRARDELWQMMEDKYNELIADGKSKNEAVGTVISEFGNLDDLAEALGLTEELYAQTEADGERPTRLVEMEDAQIYMKARSESSMKRSLGIALCILSVVFPILAGTFLSGGLEVLGVLGLFLSIAAGVVLIVWSNVGMREWSYFRTEKCMLSMDAVKYVKDEKLSYGKFHTIQLTVGILLCALCWLPCVLFTELSNANVAGEIGATILFIMVALGVMMIVYSAQIVEGFDRLMALNGTNTVSGNYVPNPRKGEVKYQNQAQEVTMMVYWPVIACIYLIVSFATVAWWITWIIWPIAAIVRTILVKVWTVQE